MKTKLLFIFLFTSISSFAQQFAPIGAKWHYTEKWAWAWPLEESYITIESTKDTLIKGVQCRKLQSPREFCGGFASTVFYVYDSDSIVYFFNSNIDTFQILYNFKAKKNDSWMLIYPIEVFSESDTLKVIVDSVGTQVINSIPLKVLYVKYESFHNSNFSYNSKIIERIGDFDFLFNFHYYPVICDANYSGGLRCYEDPVFGFYSTGIAPSCTYKYVVGINNKEPEAATIKLFPNPANDNINIIINNNNQLEGELYDNIGRLVHNDSFKNQIEWNISGLNKGLYFIKIIDEKRTLIKSFKIIKD